MNSNVSTALGWDLHHSASAVLTAMQFYKAWMALITLEVEISDHK
jgi:hypothetical protein